MSTGWRLLTALGTTTALALTAHTLWNIRALREPQPPRSPVPERVSILLPVRDEEHNVGECLDSLSRQQGLMDAEILVLDDRSRDATAELVRHHTQADSRVTLIAGEENPTGWLGKPFACHQLATRATGTILVFVDADVRLQPHAVAAAVTLCRDNDLDLISPYPRQLADGVGPRLVQPLLQWSWLTTLPLRVAERSSRPSLAAANGQFLVVDRQAYSRAGGHSGVRAEVIEDVALLRSIKRVGGRGGMADGTRIATCRMYQDWPAVVAGYEKSLWAAFGSRPAATGALGLLLLAYVVPPVAALGGSRAGMLGYAGAVLGRCVVARRTGQRVLPDVLGHPLSILSLAWLTWRSWRGHRAGRLRWKDRPVVLDQRESAT